MIGLGLPQELLGPAAPTMEPPVRPPRPTAPPPDPEDEPTTEAEVAALEERVAASREGRLPAPWAVRADPRPRPTAVRAEYESDIKMPLYEFYSTTGAAKQ